MFTELQVDRQVLQTLCLNNRQQEGLAVASIARDDPSPLPGMHRDHNVPACTQCAPVWMGIWNL